MDIITIKGEKDSGKTSLINYVLIQLLDKGAKLNSLETCGHGKEDFKASLRFNNKIVILCSIGDALTYIKEGLEFARKESGEIYINALSEKNVNTDDYEMQLQQDEKIIKIIPRKTVGSENIRKKNKILWKKILKEM